MKLVRLSLILAFLLFVNFTFANIWMDEDFDDGIAFDDMDTYYHAASAPPPWASITHNGALDSSGLKYFPGDGLNSYQVSAGQSVTGNEPYKNPTNGPFQYIQFGVNAGSIPSAGTMAILRWNWDYDGGGTADYSYFVRFDSDGSKIDIIAGEDTAGGGSLKIGELINTIDWKYITLQMQKNTTAENEPRLSQIGVTQSMRFYCSSSTPIFTIPYALAAAINNAKTWSLSVSAGSLFIDNMYWEGAITTDSGALANSKLRWPDTGIVDVSDWMIY